ncbi:putative ABC transport system permease protein [Chitinophaga terrae (ex Kim and Jung 2007)]|uniref:Putative ABC transport system permease protein n=2 Tax=Chitinophaga terrae (ex Kim and Jung 2007) TaxID=408074 RepID=A0A1H4D6N5_9BACT|nr:putative ABC transport system permease protein [Chitinophaga terrae (ex Kim and Jung 2007)]
MPAAVHQLFFSGQFSIMHSCKLLTANIVLFGIRIGAQQAFYCTMIRNYIKIALRNLRNNKVYSLINIVGLTIGLTCAMLILLYVKDEVSFDRFHKKGASIYRVVFRSESNGEVRGGSSTGLLEGPRFSQNVAGIKSYVRVQDGRVNLKNGPDVVSQDLLFVDPSFFSVFSFDVIDGDPKSCLKEPHSVVLTKDEAKKRFGTTNAVGKMLMLEEQGKFVPYQVTAITENCPENSTIQYRMLLPMREKPGDLLNTENWFSAFLNTFVVLDDKADPRAVIAQMQRFYEKDAGETFRMLSARYGNKNRNLSTYSLQPMLDIHMSTTLSAQNGLQHASNPIYAYILSGIALFVLLIANINFVNLTVARSVRRAKEIGIRKAVGSDRKQLIIQFLGESFILCTIAFSLAVLLAFVVLPVFNELANKKLSLSYLLDAKLVASYIVLYLLAGLLAGFYPAMVLSGYKPVETLYSRFTLKGKGILQKSLVVLQFTLASFLIIATFTVYFQFEYLTKADLGFDDSNLVVVNKDNMTHEEAAAFKNELLTSHDIQSVAPKNGGYWGTGAKLPNDSSIMFAWETIDESYLQTLKLPIVKGRNFSADFPGDSAQSILINETFAKEAGWKDPIGKSVFFNYRDRTYQVIGVVKDYHFRALNEKIRPQVFTMANYNPYGTFYIKIRPNTAASSLSFIERKFRQFFPLTPYSYVFMDELNRNRYESEARWKKIIFFGAILTIFISCIGLFGLSVLAAEKRTKEIGIRKVLGASVQNIATVLSIEFVKLVMIALLIAMPLAWFAGKKWLDNYPYRITFGWTIFGYAALLVTLIAIFTVSFQAVKAALANPVKSLRSE